MTDDASIRPSTREQVLAELRFMAGAFMRPFAITVLVIAVVYALVVALTEPDPAAPSKAILVPVAFGYGAFVGVWPGMLVGGLRLCWRLVGGWTLLPLVLVPTAIALSLWAGAGLLTDLAEGVWDAAVQAGAEREWLAGAVAGAAHAGPIILVVLLPLLLVDLGAIALDPHVLWATFVLLLAFGGVLLLAVVPATLVSIPLLLRAYLVRLRARVLARRERAHGRSSDRPR